MYFSGEQLDQLATMLEHDANIERDNTKTSEERILIALEAKAGIQNVDPGVPFAERILNAEAILTNYQVDNEM